jgi:hypothetical protein
MWIENPLVADVINRRMTGGPSHWLNHFVDHHLPQKALRILSLFPADLGHEQLIARRTGCPVVFDVAVRSSNAAEAIISEAAAQGLEVRIIASSEQAFVDLPFDARYDVIVNVSTLDRAEQPIRVLERVAAAMDSGPVFCGTAYTGPDENRLPTEQSAIVEHFLAALDPEWHRRKDISVANSGLVEEAQRRGVRRNAGLIHEWLVSNLDFITRRYAGGGLLEPIFALVDEARLAPDNYEAALALRLLVAADEELTQAGTLPHHLMFYIGRRRS